MSSVHQMNLGGSSGTDAQLVELKKELVEVLEKINRIRPIQFLDWESEYVYNFLGLLDKPEDDRLYICVSGEHDNLPAHSVNPIRNSRNQEIGPCDIDTII